MTDPDQLSEQFEAQRPYLRAIAYRMLGSTSEAEDAVQESWLRLGRADADAVVNLRAWLTTVVGRVCLDMLRARRARREELVADAPPDPVVRLVPEEDPEAEALLADSVGLALLVVLETLSPAERLAFVLHDMFSVPFEDIAAVVGRTPEAARQLASRARRRVRGAAPAPDADLAVQRRVVDAFLAAARAGDFEALLEVLDPDVVLRADGDPLLGPGRRQVRGAAAVARGALIRGRRFAPLARPAIVNGAAGAVLVSAGKPVAVVGFTVAGARIRAIDIVADPERLARLEVVP
jgi:RNA polymerase sigma factor (sigma-70 family)